MINYLALGDSYTIGESVDEGHRWPVELSRLLQANTEKHINTEIIAKTGWTTDELIEAIESRKLKPEYDLVTLLIGVNNQYRGYNIEQYRKEFSQLLKMAVEFAGGDNKHVFVLSIPDYGVTPFGKSKDPRKIATEINQYNEIAKEICTWNEIKFIDITDISRKADEDPSLVAEDGLHPSAEMYREWVEKAFPVIFKGLK
ncbi:MAG: SGNH/GDSL hydrolase family protein [Bacteroidota bacterium]